MNAFEQTLLELFGQERFQRIQNTRIGIAGAGGIGSNCAAGLLRVGFRHLTIVDYDKVSFSNLNRQFYFYHQVGMSKVTAVKQNLLEINPGAAITGVNAQLNKENMPAILGDCDVIVEALDNPSCKRELVECMLPTNKFIVSVSGIAGWQNIDDVKINRIKSHFYIVGDMKSEVCDNMPPLAPKVQVAALMQTNLILAYVFGDLDGEDE